jgi:hypothetical protein
VSLPSTPPLQRLSENRGRDYSELDGGQGREVNFRPPRYRTADFGLLDPIVRVTVADITRVRPLVDVSQSGVAFESAPDLHLELGTTIDQLTVAFDDVEAYRGSARVSSIRREDGAVIVGASFVDSLMAIDDVLHLRDVKGWREQYPETFGLGACAWHVPGHERFKALVSELRLFLEDSQQHLGKLETALPWHVLHGESESPARAALVEKLREQFVPEVVRYTEQIDAAVRLASAEEAQALKEYSIRNLHEYFMQSPWMRRALHKPLGYPGDYVVMRYFYERPFEGTTLFAKAINLAGASCKGAKAVRSRKNMIKGRLRSLVDAEGSYRPLSILSIAAGPAQEVFELLSELSEVRFPIEVVLFDQDKEALNYAYSRLKPLVQKRFPGMVHITYVHDSIRHLLTDGTIFGNPFRFDVVFSCGLFDYLQFPTAVALCKNLAANVAAGGALYVGNVVPSNPSRWLMEHHLDWYLVARTHEETIEFGKRAVPDGRIQIIEEETGVNPFIEIIRD